MFGWRRPKESHQERESSIKKRWSVQVPTGGPGTLQGASCTQIPTEQSGGHTASSSLLPGLPPIRVAEAQTARSRGTGSSKEAHLTSRGLDLQTIPRTPLTLTWVLVQTWCRDALVPSGSLRQVQGFCVRHEALPRVGPSRGKAGT